MSDYIFIKATGQSEGDLHLSGAGWGVSKSIIKVLRVVTSSTDWDLYILQNDNGHSANDANIPELQIMKAGNGNANIYLNITYEDEDASDEIHFYYIDNSGSNTADIYVIGLGLVDWLLKKLSVFSLGSRYPIQHLDSRYQVQAMGDRYSIKSLGSRYHVYSLPNRYQVKSA
jgi:hypothetical protein